MKHKWILAALAVLLTAALILPGCGNEQVTLTAPAADAPMGMRRFLNYDGHRYAFLENGGSYALPKDAATEKLGVLEFDLLQDPRNLGSRDFAATFAVGGTVFKTKLWDPAFRIAVQLEDHWYVCESVDVLGEGQVIPAEYFAAADFPDAVEAVELWDHMKREKLQVLSAKEGKKLIGQLSLCQPVELQNSDYEAVGRAQQQGGSFTVRFSLKDSTHYDLFVIPELGLAMLGDNKYTLPQSFAAEFGPVFEALPHAPIPMV